MDGVSDSADLWRLTVQHSPIGMALVDLDGGLMMVNRAFGEMLGYDVDELSKRGFQELTHPDDLDADLELFDRTVAGEIDSYRLSKRYLHASGRIVWGDLSVALVRGPAGEPLHFISQVLDMTEQREAEDRFKKATEEGMRDRQTLEAIFETVGVGLLLIGADGRYERMNRRHQETMSLPFPDGHAGQSGQLGEVFLVDGRTRMPKEQMPSYRAVQGEEFDDLRYWVGRDPQRRTAFSVSARQLRNPDGTSRGAALAYQDVTDLLRAMQVQDAFVSSVSHELRTPLSSVMGYLELLSEHEGLPGEVTAQLNIVERNVLRLRALLSDLLDVAQAREGTLRLERSAIDLTALAREAAQAVLPAAAEAGLDVVVEGPDSLVVDVDGQRLRQVLDNLLSNAVKYSARPGQVRVAVVRRDDAVEVAIHDTGVGIPAGEVEKVFDRFFRGASALGQHLPGTGLGLNIVRSIVESHGGRITLDSEPGRGSTFLVVLPHRTA